MVVFSVDHVLVFAQVELFESSWWHLHLIDCRDGREISNDQIGLLVIDDLEQRAGLSCTLHWQNNLFVTR